MLRMRVAFVPVAVVLTLVPGAATVLVVRRAAVSGRRAAFATLVGLEAGALLWAISAGLWLAAAVAASETLFTVIKLVSAAVLIAMGVVLVTIDLIWYSTLAALVAHAADRFIKRWLRRGERPCGTVLVGLGVRLALESR